MEMNRLAAFWREIATRRSSGTNTSEARVICTS